MMETRIRAIDWMATKHGAPGPWPRSVEAATELLLAAPQPTAIGCGPDLVELHNDAFAALIGADPAAVEAPQSLPALCGSLWPRVEPLVELARRAGEASAIEGQLHCSHRCGYAEETYLTCTCSPLLDDAGAVGGVMLTLSEQTEHVLSIRRTAMLRDVAAEAATARSVVDGCQRALAAIARHGSDIPFALLYVRDADRSAAVLAGAALLTPGTSASPESIALGPAQAPADWPVGAALDRNEMVVVDHLVGRFGTLPAGGWPFAPKTAVVVPVTSLGHDAPDSVLVAGLSARHELDAQYRGFIDLLVKQIAAVVAAGRVHEDEEHRATERARGRRARARRRAHIRALRAKFAGAFEERTRLAQEIHDTLLQGVTGIGLQLRAALPRVQRAPDTAAETLMQLMQLTEKISREAREAVWDMRPEGLPGGDVVRAVEAAAQGLAGEMGVAVHVAAAGRARALHARQQAGVLRIVQEAVANVVRHAQARTVHIRFIYGERRLHVAVVDDGCGFSVEEDVRAYVGHWGLLGMHERALDLGGTLTVRSAPGHGTRVTLLLPYADARRQTVGGLASPLRPLATVPQRSRGSLAGGDVKPRRRGRASRPARSSTSIG